jgi:hypothetical protein
VTCRCVDRINVAMLVITGPSACSVWDKRDLTRGVSGGTSKLIVAEAVE